MMHRKAADNLRVRFEVAAALAALPGAERGFLLATIDDILDSFLDWDQRATEWDADRWGLPTDAMEPLLDALGARSPAGARR